MVKASDPVTPDVGSGVGVQTTLTTPDAMQHDDDGTTKPFALKVPVGAKAGSKLKLKVPGSEPGTSETVTVRVPEGATPGKVINFNVYYEIDDDTSKHVLELETYGGDDVGSWVLLEDDEEMAPVSE